MYSAMSIECSDAYGPDDFAISSGPGSSGLLSLLLSTLLRLLAVCLAETFCSTAYLQFLNGNGLLRVC